MLRWSLPFALALSLFTPPPLVAQPVPAGPPKPLAGAELKDYIRANYTKYEYQIPMRDGVKLFTAVYVPKDDSQTYPMLLIRTPYSVAPYGADKYPDALRPGAQFVKSGYIFVNQDVRGRWMSEGEFVNVRPAQPREEGQGNRREQRHLRHGRVAHQERAGAQREGRHHRHLVPGVLHRLRDDRRPPGGEGRVARRPRSATGSSATTATTTAVCSCRTAFNFMYGFGKNRPEPTKKFGRVGFEHGTPDGYKFFLEMGPLANADAKHYKGEIAFWNEVMAHGTYDEFWKARNIRQHMKNIKPAVLTVGGWFDAENLFGALEIYKHAEANSPPNRTTTW